MEFIFQTVKNIAGEKWCSVSFSPSAKMFSKRILQDTLKTRISAIKLNLNINFLPNDKFLDSSKLEAFADDIIQLNNRHSF